MRLLLTRPDDEARALALKLAAAGHESLIEPMLTISPDGDAPLDLAGAQGLLLTSANGARALRGRAAPPELPVFAVGDATAEAAREQGFNRVESADGDVENLATLVAHRLDPGDGALVHVAGSVAAGDLAGRLANEGFDVRRAVLYRAHVATTLSVECRNALEGGTLDGALFFSPRTAAAFVRLVAAVALSPCCRTVTAFCLSDAVARAAAAPWRAVRVAAAPRAEALLALLSEETER